MTSRATDARERSAAFVVWIDPQAAGSDGPQVHGAVEHIQSAERIEFSELSELTGFLLAHANSEDGNDE